MHPALVNAFPVGDAKGGYNAHGLLAVTPNGTKGDRQQAERIGSDRHARRERICTSHATAAHHSMWIAPDLWLLLTQAPIIRVCRLT